MLMIAAIVSAESCSRRPPIETVPGPEEDSILARASGIILTDGSSHELVTLTLPDASKRVIRTLPPGDAIYALAGPARTGRIVYFANNMMAKRHALRVTNSEGLADTVIFERSGDALWDSVIGRDMAVSPSGEKVAFIGKHHIPNIEPSGWDKKAGLLEIGNLDIWMLDSKTPIETGVRALDRGLDWFPDGNRLVYATLLPHDEVLRQINGATIGGGFDQWSKVPVVFILDLQGGTSRFLHVGWSPVVSPDGRWVLVSDLNSHHWLVDPASHQSQRITWPGDWGGPIAFVGENLILYWGLPTTGSEALWTEKNSPFVGPKPMVTLKVADFTTGKFKTVLSPVDPRTQVSFGRPSLP